MRSHHAGATLICALAWAAVAGSCGGSHAADAPATGRYISAKQAKAAADAAEGGSWHPRAVRERLDLRYRKRPSAPPTPVWVVSYLGGDVCIPAHGGASTPCAHEEDVLVNAVSGRFIAASAGLIPAGNGSR